MRKLGILIFLISLLACPLFSNAQDSNVSDDSTQIGGNPFYFLAQQKYLRAVKYGDPEVAKDALYDLVTIDPGNDSLLFQLGYLYYEQGQLFPAVFVMNDVLEVNPRYNEAREILAVCYRQAGALDKAVESYEKLYLDTYDLNVLYNLTVALYDSKRYTEANSYLDTLIGSDGLDGKVVLYNSTAGGNQEVPMKAAAYYLKGMVALAQDDKAKAKSEFDNALQIMPDFEQAKEEAAKL
ncbi:tetratricopeptide repeat protein [Aureibacter tunicatorum]|uniref:Tetratricopeptide (TPR) repeat protein n=1 Tax=Aureibacter tunicatorum TaxID=866807 RepID=A0AAE4BS76_9BACT|nr:tetratricopeptide repeat protein [Aureibacter tunicatorum]MDR6239471.1 tetratricopeptide (TPR) repeat protein [Aureibacter tunicatorum]BDD04607.1 hypothetical protein AUTU_20900 [Aureibacter tunicatorum]